MSIGVLPSCVRAYSASAAPVLKMAQRASLNVTARPACWKPSVPNVGDELDRPTRARRAHRYGTSAPSTTSCPPRRTRRRRQLTTARRSSRSAAPVPLKSALSRGAELDFAAGLVETTQAASSRCRPRSRRPSVSVDLDTVGTAAVVKLCTGPETDEPAGIDRDDAIEVRRGAGEAGQAITAWVRPMPATDALDVQGVRSEAVVDPRAGGSFVVHVDESRPSGRPQPRRWRPPAPRCRYRTRRRRPPAVAANTRVGRRP